MRSQQLRALESVSPRGGTPRQPIRRTGNHLAHRFEPYLFLLPFFLLYAAFGMFGFVYTGVASLFSLSGAGGHLRFVAFANYVKLFTSDIFFGPAVWNTFYIFVATVIPLSVGGFLLALLLNNRNVRGRVVFRTIYILPFVTSAVIIAIVFTNLFDSQYGWINIILHRVGLPIVPWLTSDRWSKIAVSILDVWQWLGYNMVLMLGGLQSIPQSIIEATEIDGCRPFQRMVRIIVPMMKPTILFVLIMSTIGTLNMFTQPYVLTNGGPNYSTTTLTLYLYDVAFQFGRLGYASALAMVIFLISLVTSVGQFRVLRGGSYE